VGALAVVLVVALAVAGPAWGAEAQITEEKVVEPRVVELTISTPALSSPTHVDVDLPAGQTPEPGRRLPAGAKVAVKLG
jgi:hypothetical protein